MIHHIKIFDYNETLYVIVILKCFEIQVINSLKTGELRTLRNGVPPAFRKKTTLRKSELKNQKIYHYSKTHTVSFFIQKIIQHNINCVVLGVIININLGV
ncbi:hypothetical protein BK789_00735 [Bacillus thuringiensis serovar darmstadiensis]|nr:hypothetical protein BK789_00735 [Bacillus thuringiensis serovar darmstadiensis]